MRITLSSRPGVVFGSVFAMALVVLLPLRMVAGGLGLGDAGVSARAVQGSVWLGRMDEAAVGGLPLGDVDARLALLPLVAGRARVAVAARSDPDGLHGAVVVSRHTTGIDDVTARLAAGATFAPLPITELDLSDVRVRFADERCAEAAGRVRAVMAGDVAGIDLGGGMAGDVRCDGDALLLPLVSPARTERVLVRISGDGRYRAELTVQPPDAAAVQRLALAGFRPTSQGYALTIEGMLH